LHGELELGCQTCDKKRKRDGEVVSLMPSLFKVVWCNACCEAVLLQESGPAAGAAVKLSLYGAWVSRL